MSQANEQFEPFEPAGLGPAGPDPDPEAPDPRSGGPGSPGARTWILWGLWRVLLLAIAVTGFAAGEGAWRWVWLGLLTLVVATTWLSRPGRRAAVPAALSEPGDHRVVLQLPGDKQILVIRALRRITGADLAAAKKLAESAPVVVVENLSQESAAQAVHLLTSAGARATVTPMDRSE
jgi:large subunit ribosomal protein L7/L12